MTHLWCSRSLSFDFIDLSIQNIFLLMGRGKDKINYGWYVGHFKAWIWWIILLIENIKGNILLALNINIVFARKKEFSSSKKKRQLLNVQQRQLFSGQTLTLIAILEALHFTKLLHCFSKSFLCRKRTLNQSDRLKEQPSLD